MSGGIIDHVCAEYEVNSMLANSWDMPNDTSYKTFFKVLAPLKKNLKLRNCERPRIILNYFIILSILSVCQEFLSKLTV